MTALAVGSTRNSTWPYSTGCWFSTRISAMTPVQSAGISLKIFIASIRQTTVVGRDPAPTRTNGSASGLGRA